ncbi:MAG: phosphoenolpyruvate--protein phosphotransferase [Candidatus Aminicenantes bacterium]|nr:phosphoenolpyruvate--protein phosphotransferase [Candidatus Aminicenantes bacterium]
MASDLEFSFPLPQGLHARPASRIQDLAAGFAAEVRWDNLRTGGSADAKSVLALIGSDTLFEDPCRIRVTGPNAEAAAAALRKLILEDLPRDEAAVEEAPPPSGPGVPWFLARGRSAYFLGQPAGAGVVRGPAHVHQPGTESERPARTIAASEIEREIEAYRAAVRASAEAMGQRRDAEPDATAKAVLNAHLAILKDRAFAAEAERLIAVDHWDAPSAATAAGRTFRERLGAGRSRYLRERMADIADVTAVLVGRLDAHAPASDSIRLSGPAVLVADDLAPSQFLGIDRDRLLGLVLENAGSTSHTLIMARARGVPAVAGCPGLARLIRTGEEVVVDGNRGLVVPSPDTAAMRYFDREAAAEADSSARRRELAKLPGRTIDGHRVEIAANIGHPEELASAWGLGAEGVGLFRTEMLLLGRTEAPGEDEQYEIYARAARESGGRPIIVRTFDIGGDKPLPYLPLPVEKNPFLGLRGVRVYERFADLIGAQLRALLRAAVHGPLKIMVPMIGTLDELVRFRAMVREAADRLAAASIPHRAAIEVGMMVEVPSAALFIDRFSDEADFFSVGSNDLLQYVFAADRGNPDVRNLGRPLDPAFLRLLETIVRAAKARGRWVGLCGEMAGSPRHLPLLVGLGFDELSLTAGRIPDLKAGLVRLDFEACRRLTEAALRAAKPEEVEAALDEFGRTDAPASLTEPGLIRLESDARSKDEAVQELGSLMESAGRVDRRAELEEALRRREDTSSTSIGFGVAIPHGKTPYVHSPCMAVLRFAAPFLWEADDEQPVDLAVMLAIPSGRGAEEHLKLLARLSRRLMHEEFRDALRSAPDRDAIVRLIGEAVEG